jgi:ornithine cyclodeaminase/alanine dehydrogenase-like protein (mu-crystallin family)
VSDLLYLDRACVRRLLPTVEEQVDRLAEVYRALAHGRVENPPKLGVHPRPSAFIHAMPAHLADEDVTAVKWVSAYPGNPARGLPYISGLIVLNDSDTGLPVAVMDAAEITAVRTAAASGVSVRHLAHPGWRRAAILGYGEQGREHAKMLRALNPDAAVVVYGGPRLTGPVDDVDVVPDARSAVEGADVVVTAGPMSPDPERRLDPTWLQPRCLVVPVDFSAYVGADLALRADDLVTDDLPQFAHYRALGHFDGWPEPSRSLGEALETEPAGDLRVSCSLGVGAVDAAVAAVVLERARREGVGVELRR